MKKEESMDKIVKRFLKITSVFLILAFLITIPFFGLNEVDSVFNFSKFVEFMLGKNGLVVFIPLGVWFTFVLLGLFTFRGGLGCEAWAWSVSVFFGFILFIILTTVAFMTGTFILCFMCFIFIVIIMLAIVIGVSYLAQ